MTDAKRCFADHWQGGGLQRIEAIIVCIPLCVQDREERLCVILARLSFAFCIFNCMFFPRVFGIAAMLYGTQHMTLTVDQKSKYRR